MENPEEVGKKIKDLHDRVTVLQSRLNKANLGSFIDGIFEGVGIAVPSFLLYGLVSNVYEYTHDDGLAALSLIVPAVLFAKPYTNMMRYLTQRTLETNKMALELEEQINRHEEEMERYIGSLG